MRPPWHVLAAALVAILVASASASTYDAQFRERYTRQYEAVSSLEPDMVVEELRLRLEAVASRGSQVGATSNDRRVRGFESALLKALQDALCPAGQAGAQRPSALVVDSVVSAARAMRLRTADTDVAELTALAQRLIDSQPPVRWCALRSLDEIR